MGGVVVAHKILETAQSPFYFTLSLDLGLGLGLVNKRNIRQTEEEQGCSGFQ